MLERARERPPVLLPPEEVSIESRIEQLLERLSETEACGFEDLFESDATRGDMIVTFLAMLEMIRLKLIRVFQQGGVGAIRVYKRARPSDAPHPIHDPEDEYKAHHPAPPKPGTGSRGRERNERREQGCLRCTRCTEVRAEDRCIRRAPEVHGRARGARCIRDAETAEEPKPRMELAQLKAVIEALMFASPDPITPRMLNRLLNDEPKEDVKAALEALKADYVDRGGLHIAEVAGGFQITTRPEYHEWVRRLFHERSANKLSVASLETLSVIAYKQPVTAAEIGEIRSVNTSGVLSTLLERHLIKIVGRKNVIGRPFLYGTTKEFLIRFGLNDLGDLPKIEDMAQQLGFEPPPILMEQPVPEEMLPLDEGDVPEGRASEHV